MMDPTCTECERLWEAYHSALHSQLIIEYDSPIQTGLDVLVREASKRCQQAQQDLQYHHEASHRTLSGVASATV